ncbi:hypothetical protein GCM10007967_28050 [Xylanimonas ulmi]
MAEEPKVGRTPPVPIDVHADDDVDDALKVLRLKMTAGSRRRPDAHLERGLLQPRITASEDVLRAAPVC